MNQQLKLMAGLLAFPTAIMIRNYLVTTLRNLVRNGMYSVINILGLSIGITACIVIFLLIRYDLGFDRLHKRYDAIYRVVQHSRSASGEEYGSATPYPFAGAFRNDFPQIPLVTQLHYEGEVFLRVDDKKFVTENVIFADSLFFQVFDFSVLAGNPQSDLAEPGKAFVSESLAAKLGYIPGSGPLTVRVSNRIDVDVVGVFRDVPSASHIQFEMAISMPSLTSDFVGGLPLDHWSMTASGFTYVALPSDVSPSEVEQSFKAFVEKYYRPEDSKRKSFALQPLSEIHFDQRYTENPGPGTNASYKELKIVALLGGFILVIGCINFINLSTALAVRKSREIGVRKALGARRIQLASYFLTETLFVTSLAILISLGLAEWLTPWINGFIGKEISLRLFSDGALVLFLVGLALITTLLSGFYPALVLSGFSPIVVLKNKMVNPPGAGIAVRKVLVVCQFIIAQVLIIGTLIISDQMEFFRTKPLGFDKEAVVLVNIPENKKELLTSLKERLLNHRAIGSVSFSLGAPTSDNNFGTNYFLTERGGGELHPIGVKPVDRDYLETYGLQLKAGRWFTESEERSADPSLPEDQQHYVYLLNESGARQMGFDNPEEIIGKNITTGLNRINAEVIGIVKDFHVTSLHTGIKPVVLVSFPNFYYEAGIKIKASDLREAVGFIEKPIAFLITTSRTVFWIRNWSNCTGRMNEHSHWSGSWPQFPFSSDVLAFTDWFLLWRTRNSKRSGSARFWEHQFKI